MNSHQTLFQTAQRRLCAEHVMVSARNQTCQ
jgi:hypothetical protein